MPWRIAAVLVIVILGFGEWSTASGSTPTAYDGSAMRASPSFANDNNLIEDLFQSFNGNTNDDGGRKKKTTIGPLPPPVSAPAAQPSSTDADARARAGRETAIFLANDRVVVRVPPTLPDDLEVGIQVVRAPASVSPRGPIVGGLLFRVSARPIGGDPLARLPIEVNLSTRYTDAELGSLDEGRLMLSWFDPSANQWKPAPKPAADPRNNYLSATIQELGLYAAHQAP